jgi:hypothetical protein
MLEFGMQIMALKLLKIFRNDVFWPTFLSVSFLTAIVSSWRMIWSWPNALWLGDFWIIDDVNNLMLNRFSNVTWFEFATRQWSINSWRWFTYINVKFFHWNMDYEIFAYYLIVLIMTVAVVKRYQPQISGKKKLLFFLIPGVLLNFVGAGARGMELGTFFGILIFILLILQIFRNSTRLTIYQVYIVTFFLIFV